MQWNVFFVMSVELNQQITTHINGYTPCFYFLLCSYGYTGNGRQSTHYAITDLNGAARSIHSISSTCSQEQRRKCESIKKTVAIKRLLV